MQSKKSEFFLEKGQHIFEEGHFPIIKTDKDIIYFHFREENPLEAKVQFMLFEYSSPFKGLRRWKSIYKWKKGWTIAFNPVADYTLKRRTGYKLEVTYKNRIGEDFKHVIHFYI